MPERFISDNDPQFASNEYVVFSKDYGFEHGFSNPTHASGNGDVERAVRTTYVPYVNELLYVQPKILTLLCLTVEVHHWQTFTAQPSN